MFVKDTRLMLHFIFKYSLIYSIIIWL